MLDEKDPAWQAAREATRDQVRAALAPVERECPACGRREKTASRTCPHCGSAYAARRPRRRLSRRQLLALLAGLTAVAAVLLVLAPGIREARERDRAREARERAELRQARIERLRREGRVVQVRRAPPAALAGAPAAEQRRLRRSLVADVERTVHSNSLTRFREGEIRQRPLRGDCEPSPRNVRRIGAETTLAAPTQRYHCLAVTADIERQAGPEGVIGYPFYALVDFERWSYAICRIAGRPGEGSLRHPEVTPPRECGG
jgi:hypothetical protein